MTVFTSPAILFAELELVTDHIQIIKDLHEHMMSWLYLERLDMHFPLKVSARVGKTTSRFVTSINSRLDSKGGQIPGKLENCTSHLRLPVSSRDRDMQHQ